MSGRPTPTIILADIPYKLLSPFITRIEAAASLGLLTILVFIYSVPLEASCLSHAYFDIDTTSLSRFLYFARRGSLSTRPSNLQSLPPFHQDKCAV